MGIRGCRVPRSPGRRAQGIRGHSRMSSLWATKSRSGQTFRQHLGKRHQASRSAMENSCRNQASKGSRRGSSSPNQDVENLSIRSNGHGATRPEPHMGRGGFLKGQRTQPGLKTKSIVCGTSQKRGAEEPEGEARCKKPWGGPRPIITMLLHVGQEKHRVQVLLDTGCSVLLVNKKTARALQIPILKHDQAIRIENYTGQNVEEAGIFYTKPLLLQHCHTR